MTKEDKTNRPKSIVFRDPLGRPMSDEEIAQWEEEDAEFALIYGNFPRDKTEDDGLFASRPAKQPDK